LAVLLVDRTIAPAFMEQFTPQRLLE
jgi:hypothetical protein